jgi:SAM-dependent methyltransferase
MRNLGSIWKSVKRIPSIMNPLPNLDNQSPYWDRVAPTKHFTHPLDLALLEQYLPQKDALIIDFGCGYGRTVHELLVHGYTFVCGCDTSAAMIARGRAEADLPIFHITSPADLPQYDGEVDAILLFAVLTCIPSNAGQRELIALLHRKLRPGGLLYISDYYLQEDRLKAGAYQNLDDDPENAGVFTLPENVTLRHHTRPWIQTLLQDFVLMEEKAVDVLTMNGNRSQAFQLIVRR